MGRVVDGPAGQGAEIVARRRGMIGYHAGFAAEDIVARDYQRRGYLVIHRRWRSPGGEIDLIARQGDIVVVIEVKRSRSFGMAAFRLGARQMRRLCTSAALFLEREPRGQLTDMRFDLALVDGEGRVMVIENAFGAA